MDFISDFMGRPVPAERSWMTHYFKEGLCADFLKYFVLFGSVVHFSEHVGKPCSVRWAMRMKSRFRRLERARDEARRSMDIELLADIESGRFELD
jgi:hypothetical protein